MLDFLQIPLQRRRFRRLVVYLAPRRTAAPGTASRPTTTIRDNFLEETYEACEAIDNEDTGLLREELGDVLMQVMFTSIKKDAGHFDLDDVADAGLQEGSQSPPPRPLRAGGRPELDKLKRREKGYTTHAQCLEAVARSLPALWRARKVQSGAGEAELSPSWTGHRRPPLQSGGGGGQVRQAVTGRVRTWRKSWGTPCLWSVTVSWTSTRRRPSTGPRISLSPALPPWNLWPAGAARG